MSTKYLGDKFDIHGGGMDLKFPHHECEIAQCKAAKGNDPVKYWMHANMLEMNGARMSKSTGNYVNPAELFSGNSEKLSKGFSPGVVRFFMMQASYRSILDLTNDGLLAAEKGFNRLMEAISNLDKLKVGDSSSFDVKAWRQKCYDAMNDDFNTPILIAHLFDAVKHINQIKDNKASISNADLDLLTETMEVFVFDILGLVKQYNVGESTDKLNAALELLIQLRKEARQNKDFTLSDQIRDELAKSGITLKDGREGTTYSIN